MRLDRDQPRPSLALIAGKYHRFITAKRKADRALRSAHLVARFAERGDGLQFDPDGYYSFENIHLGHNVNLGVRPTLLATRSTIRIGNHVMFGPFVTVRGGNHRVDMVGRFMDSISETEKRPIDDPGVIIEDDVWVAGHATILGGVKVGRGSVIAASAVVTRDVEPYSIVGGNPARKIRMRFSPTQILAHEEALHRLGLSIAKSKPRD